MTLFTSRLVVPLDASFQAITDGVARARGWPTSSEPARLGALVRKLSDAYNHADVPPPRNDEALAARLGFSFARDVPKGAAAVRELLLANALVLPEDRPLRVLDLGAGLGATTRGIARALAAVGAKGSVAVDAVDSDGAALEVASAIARARPSEAGVTIDLRTQRAGVDADFLSRGPYDLVVLGQVLSELDREAGHARVERHAARVEECARLVGEDGAVVLVEPALRERTRHLHAVRDALLARTERRLHVFAPCVHDDACPMLAEPNDWCHEDLDVDLPPWLVPVARAAGLRWQGLTFSYLVLRKDGRRIVGAGMDGAIALRAVSSAIVTKGKRELYLCGRFEGDSRAERRRVMRLDRHATAENAAWEAAARGDVVTLQPPAPAARPRVEPETRVTMITRDDADVRRD